MNALDAKTLRKFLKLAGDRLQGKWVIIGGTVLPLLGVEHRSTVDIDLAGPPKATQKDTLALMEIAQELGLPVESLNQAGAFFLFKIKDWEKKTIELYRGKTAIFLRPNVELFLQLKIGRLNESDLSDCLAFLSYASKKNEPYNTDYLIKILELAIEKAQDGQSENRMARLETLLGALKKR